MRPSSLLVLLVGGAVALGGLLQGWQWRGTATGPREETAAEIQLVDAWARIEELERENESLRSLAEGGGDVRVPPELRQRVEMDLELEFQSTPQIHRVTEEMLREKVEAAVDAHYPVDGLEARARAWPLLFFIPPEQNLRNQLVAVQAVGARAWFDPTSGEGYVTDSFDPGNILDQAAMVRLLARMLIHQHFPPPERYLGDDPMRAVEALRHGLAAGAEARFMNANAREIGFMPMNEEANEGEQVMLALAPFMRGLTMFPTIEGKSYADLRYLVGAEEVFEALENPPKSTAAVMAGDRELPPPSAAVLPVIDGEVVLQETAGALGVRLLLEEFGDPQVARDVAAAWNGDGYVVFSNEAGDHAVWVTQWRDDETAEAFAGVLASLAPEPPAAGGESLDWQGEDGRHFRLRRQGTRVAFFHTADQATLEAIPPAW